MKRKDDPVDFYRLANQQLIQFYDALSVLLAQFPITSISAVYL